MEIIADVSELILLLIFGVLVGFAVGIPIGLYRKYKTGSFWPAKSARSQSLFVFYWCIPLFAAFTITGYLVKGPYFGALFLVITTFCIGDLIAHKISRNQQKLITKP